LGGERSLGVCGAGDDERVKMTPNLVSFDGSGVDGLGGESWGVETFLAAMVEARKGVGLVTGDCDPIELDDKAIGLL
jgi:hypothetical protein